MKWESAKSVVQREIESSGGGALGFARGQEDKKIGRYAIIGERSSHGICHCEGVERPSQSHNIIEPHPCPLLEKERGNKTILSPRGRGDDINSLKRTYSPIDLLTYSLKKKLAAFTLAEVLITLGIIGVVVAITLPTLINRTQNKQLQTAFKKAYSVQAQALLYTKQSLGLENLVSIFAVYDEGNKVYPFKTQFIDEYYKYLKVSADCEYNDTVRNYNNTADAYIDFGTYEPEKQLPDSSCASVNVNGFSIWVTVDVNGAKKGPNRLGHDIFVFEVDSKDRLTPVKTTRIYSDEELEDIKNNYDDDSSLANSVPAQAGNPCSKNSTQKGNGLGCSWYALNDVNPDDETKGYWESLP